MGFIPDTKPSEKPNRLGYAALKLAQAYLEDGLAGYTTERNEKKLQDELLSLLNSAGATDVSITPGKFNERPAFRLRFIYEGLAREVIQVALPAKSKTERALTQTKRQALFNLVQSIRMELERRHYQPNIPAFVGYILMPGQKQTIGEIITENKIYLLSAGDEVIEGEFFS